MAVAAPPEPEQGHGRSARDLIWVAVAAIAGCVVFYLGMLLGSSADIPANTTVVGVQIGGMSKAEAVATLEVQVGPRAEAPVPISAFSTSDEVFPADSGLSFDPVATADAAAGRIYNPIGMVLRLFGSVAVDPVVIIDEPILAERLQAFADIVSRPTAEPAVYYDGMEPVLTPGEEGRQIDIPGAAEAVANAYLISPETVALPEVVQQPAVSADDAAAYVAGPATLAVSAPVTIEVDTARPQVTPETIAEATHYLVEDGALTPQIDGALVHASIAPELTDVETPGNDATFEIDAQNVPVVVPSKVGRGVSDADLSTAVSAAMLQEGDARVASAPVTVRDPALTTEDAMTLGVVEEVSS
ncbi:MAG: peptidoglycan binding domain-containing protein, partial [Candidatus Nanopelagicales bacterium]